MKKTIFALCAFAIFSLVAMTPVRQDQQQQRRKIPEFEKEVQINLVLLDVLVLDRNGNYVNGLTKDDFIVLEDGKPMDVNTVDEYFTPPSEPQSPDQQTTVMESPPRTIIFIVDRLFTSNTGIRKGKEVLLKFIQEKLQPGDRAMILAYDRAFKTIQDITTDQRRLEMSAEGMDVNSVSLETPEMLLEMTSEADAQMRLTTSDLNNSNVTSDFIDTQRNSRLQMDIRIFLDKMQMLAKSFKALPGRKNVILLSEGYDDRLIKTDTFIMTRASDARLEDPVAREVSNGDQRPTLGPQKTSLMGTFAQMVNRINDASTSFFVIDLNSLGGERSRDDQAHQQSLGSRSDFNSARLDSLAALADSSGGKLYSGVGDFGKVMNRINYDISNFYIVSYSTDNVRSDGKFRKVEVRAKNSAYTVRSRNGYFESKSYDKMDDNERYVQLMEGFFRANPTSEMDAQSSMFFLPLYADTVVGTLSVSIPAKEFGNGAGEKTLEAVGTIMDNNGHLIDAFHRLYPYGKNLDDIRKDGAFSLKLPFLLTTGNNRVKVILRDNASGNRHYIFDEYITRGAEGEDIYMSSVMALDEKLSLCSVDKYKIKPIEKAEDSGMTGRNTPDPLKASTGKPLFPHLDLTFKQADSPVIFFSAGNFWQDPKTEQVDFYIDYALIDAAGKEHIVPVAKERLIPVPGARRVNVLSQLQLAGVDPGDYQLRVRFLDQKKLQGVQRILPITVK